MSGDFGGCPPSAAGHLEPYGVHVLVRLGPHALDPEAFLITLLQELAAECTGSGASLIAHLKCLLHTSDGAVACNLTSVRSGAACAPTSAGLVRALSPGAEARLDLAVLVYGLPAPTIDSLVRSTLARLLEPLGATWSITS